MTTNADILYALPHLPFLKNALKSTQFRIKALEAQIELLKQQEAQLGREVQCLDNVTEVVDGVALHGYEFETIYGEDCRMGASGDDIKRSAEVYTNAQTSKNGVASDWCIKLCNHDNDRSNDEKWLGGDWGYVDALLVARRWITAGALPTDEHEKMCKAFHKHAPTAKISLSAALRRADRRRQAFEAAWIAGHHELAIEILTRAPKSLRAKKAA